MKRSQRIAIGVLAITGLVALAYAQQPAPPPLPPVVAPMPEILKTYSAVTADRLLKPADGDWLMIRRSYDGWGYSPLDQITPANVSRLRAGVGLLDRRQQRPRSRADREQRRDVLLDAIASRGRDRCEDRHDPLALHQGSRRERRRAASHVARRGALWRQGVLCRERCGARGAQCANRRAGVDREGRGEQERLLHDARAARRRRQGDGWRVRRRAWRPRIRGRVRSGHRHASHGAPTPCPRPASPAARRGRRAISGRTAARRCG